MVSTRYLLLRGIIVQNHFFHKNLLVTNHLKNPDWSKLNYKYCGLGYKLNKIQLRSVPPSILQSYNSYSESYLDKCALTRDAFLTGTPVPQSAAVKHGDSVKELVYYEVLFFKTSKLHFISLDHGRMPETKFY